MRREVNIYIYIYIPHTNKKYIYIRYNNQHAAWGRPRCWGPPGQTGPGRTAGCLHRGPRSRGPCPRRCRRSRRCRPACCPPVPRLEKGDLDTSIQFCYFRNFTEKSFRNLIKSTWNQIVFTIFPLIWNQMDVRLVSNQSENGKDNLISGNLTRISGQYLSLWVVEKFENFLVHNFSFLFVTKTNFGLDWEQIMNTIIFRSI